MPQTGINVTPQDPFYLRVARGEFPTMSFIEKFGEASDIDTDTDPADLWTPGGLYTFSTSADIDTLSSSNAGDDQVIEVQGLDADYNLVLQEATLNGQSKVTLTTPLMRVFRMRNMGSTDCAGLIYCYVDGAITDGVPDTAADVRAVINDGANQTEMCIYTIPAGKTGYFMGGYVTISRTQSSGNASFTSRVRSQGGVFRVLSRVAAMGAGRSAWDYLYPIPVPIPEKSDVLLRCETVSASNTAAAGGFTILLIDN